MRSRWWLVAQAVVTVGLLTLLARSLDLAALRSALVGLPASFYFVSLGVVLGGQVAYAWRWQRLLIAAGVDVPLSNVVRQYFVGIFVNNFLPSTVGGDVAKVYYLGQQHGYRPVTASVAIDRILGVGLLAMLASVTLLISPVSGPRLRAALIACTGISIMSIALLVLTGKGTGGLPPRVAWLGNRAFRLAGRLQRLRLDMAAPLTQPAIVGQAAAVVIGYAMVVTALYMRFATLQHVAPPPFIAMFGVVTAMTVLSNVPISLNGLGLREQLHASLLAPLGLPAEIAVAVSILLYAHLMVASLIGLVFWLRTG
jgi:glycosyltransferase 2 family protein